MKYDIIRKKEPIVPAKPKIIPDHIIKFIEPRQKRLDDLVACSKSYGWLEHYDIIMDESRKEIQHELDEVLRTEVIPSISKKHKTITEQLDTLEKWVEQNKDYRYSYKIHSGLDISSRKDEKIVRAKEEIEQLGISDALLMCDTSDDPNDAGWYFYLTRALTTDEQLMLKLSL